MTTEEILEGNKLIAEFMGWEYRELTMSGLEQFRAKRATKWLTLCDTDNLTGKGIVFHSSWEWLAPVIEKIELNTQYDLTTNYDHREEFKGWEVHWFTLSPKDEILGYINDKRFKTKINASWYAVVQFIKWYNSQSK